MHMIGADVHLFPVISQSEVLQAEGPQKSVDEANWEVMSQLSALSEPIWENLVTMMEENNTLTPELSWGVIRSLTANFSAILYTDGKNQNHVTLK